MEQGVGFGVSATLTSSLRARGIYFCPEQSKVGRERHFQRAFYGNVSALQSTFWHGVFHIFFDEFTAVLLSCSLSWESVLAACSIYKLCSCTLAVSHSLIIYSSIFCTACLELLFMCWLI